MAIPTEEIKIALDLVGKLLDVVPLTVAASLLTEEARKRAEAAYAQAEAAKFGKGE